MVSRLRLILWTWVHRVHDQLHRMDDMARSYSVSDQTATTGDRVMYLSDVLNAWDGSNYTITNDPTGDD